VSGGGSDYALALCRRGRASGQCSENQYYDLHLSHASVAAYFQDGFNAIDNNWFGGDCQNYTKHCVYLIAGSIGIFKVSFESTTGYTQIENDGFDIDASSAGAYDTIVVYGSRTESMRFYRGSWSQSADLRGISQRIANFATWGAKVRLPQNYLVSKRGSDGRSHAYRVTIAGTTGDLEPIWPEAGTINDGSVRWSVLKYNAVELLSGTVDLRTSFFDETAGIRAATTRFMPFKEITSNYRTETGDELILVVPVAGDITILLDNQMNDARQLMGHQIIIKRAAASSNTVTIRGCFGGDIILPASTLDAATFVQASANKKGPSWYLVNYTSTKTH
jgi:hypothetical protein